MTGQESIPPNIMELTAPQLIGMMFNWGLWGILTVQVYFYHLFFNDSRNMKTLVYTLYSLECLQTAMASADVIHWFSRGYGRISFLSDPYVAPVDMPMMAGLIAMIVQLYFTWRIWVMGKSLPLCLVIGAISVAQCVAGFVSGIQAFQIGSLTALSSLIAPKIWLAGAAVSDTLIAVSMTYLLYRTKNRTLVPRTKYILKRVMALTVETNSLSATAAIITLILFIKFPKNTLYLCPPSALGKLYSNTLLVIFNSRLALPNDERKSSSHGLGIGLPSIIHNHANDLTSHGTSNNIKINVFRQVEQQEDPAEFQPEMNKNSSQTSSFNRSVLV